MTDKEKDKKHLTDEYYRHKKHPMQLDGFIEIKHLIEKLNAIADKRLSAAGYELEIRQYIALLRLELGIED